MDLGRRLEGNVHGSNNARDLRGRRLNEMFTIMKEELSKPLKATLRRRDTGCPQVSSFVTPGPSRSTDITSHYINNEEFARPLKAWEAKKTIANLANNPAYCSGRNTNTPMDFLEETMKEYCNNTSLHGFKYIVDEETYKFERIVWFLCCVGAIVGAIILLTPYFQTYAQGETATAIESTGRPIWEIPFPGVTICNVNKASRERINAVSRMKPWYQYYQRDSDIMEKAVKVLVAIGDVSLDDDGHDEDSLLEQLFRENKNLSDSLMNSVIQPIERMAIRCWWIGKPVNCQTIFELRRTDEGFCWSFNSEGLRKEIPKYESDLYDETPLNDTTSESDGNEETEKLVSGEEQTVPLSNNNEPKPFKPKRVNGAGPTMGLTVLLNPEISDYLAPTDNIDGFKVTIHHPNDFPYVATQGFLADAGKEIFAAIEASYTQSTKDVRASPSRKCKFTDERGLKFYESYSHANCLLECTVEMMYKKCKCIPYIYSQIDPPKTCDFKGIKCINRHLKMFSSIKPEDDVEGLDDPEESMRCPKCKSNCDKLDYSVQITSAEFPVRPEDVALPDEIEKLVNKSTLVLLRTYFDGFTYIKYKNDTKYKWVDLIAAFGGIVGLFIGFSLISGIELVYFFTLRPALRWSDYFK